MRKIFLLLLIGMFLISFATALSLDNKLGESAQYQTVNIVRMCDNCTYFNITSILYPNSSIILEDLSMTADDVQFNYSLLNTSALGNYILNFKYDNNGIVATDTKWIEVTKTGFKQTEPEALGSSMFLVLMVALTFIFGFMGFRLLDSDLLWVLGVFFVFLSLVLVIYDFWLGVVYHQLYIGNIYTSVIPQALFYLFFLSVVIGVIIAGLLVLKRIPAYVREIFPFLNREDGWDENVFDKY